MMTQFEREKRRKGVSRLVDESDIEKAVCGYAKRQGCLTIKLTSLKGFPDRLILFQGRVLWIEFKRPGAKPRKLQTYRIKLLIGEGFQVEVIDRVDKGQQIIDIFMNTEDKARNLYGAFANEIKAKGLQVRYFKGNNYPEHSWNDAHPDIQEVFRSLIKYGASSIPEARD